jgi:hypothetical protein
LRETSNDPRKLGKPSRPSSTVAQRSLTNQIRDIELIHVNVVAQRCRTLTTNSNTRVLRRLDTKLLRRITRPALGGTSLSTQTGLAFDFLPSACACRLATIAGMVSLEEVGRLALAMPGVAEGNRHGHRTWHVAGKTFMWERPFSKADVKRFGDVAPPEGPIIAVAVQDLGEKEAVLAEQHRGFFTISHFDGYPAVLIQLDVVLKRRVREAIVDGWLVCAPHALGDEYLRAAKKRNR